jgi:3-oxoacyl-[acyl-carrier-protein] synthase II
VWAKLLAGTSGICRIQRFDTDKHTSKIAGELSDWNGAPHLDPKRCKRLDRFAQFALASGIDAVTDSGLDFSKEDPFRCGAIVGSGIGGIEEFEHGHAKMLHRAPDRVSPFMIPKLMINAAAGNIAIEYGMMGPNVGTVTACASAGHAIADAYKTIVMDEADVIVTGGSEAAVTPLGVACFMTMRALSTRNDDPEHASRPVRCGPRRLCDRRGGRHPCG